MGDFVLVDLESQARAVALYLRGCTAEEKLAWLRRHGEVTDYSPPIVSDEFVEYVRRRVGVGDLPISTEPADYNGIFRSRLGLHALFTITDDRKLLVSRIDPLEQELFLIPWNWLGAPK